MLKFLFGGKKTTPVVEIETDRARFERLVTELNGVIDTLADKPRVTVDPATGHIWPQTPEQFADEALALPAPEEAPEVEADAETEVETEAETETEAAAEAEVPVAAKA